MTPLYDLLDDLCVALDLQSPPARSITYDLQSGIVTVYDGSGAVLASGETVEEVMAGLRRGQTGEEPTRSDASICDFISQEPRPGHVGAGESMSTESVLDEVRAERARQDAKWGEQNHPDGTGRVVHLDYMPAEKQADEMKGRCQEKARRGTITYSDIALEEVYEANAETDPVKLRAELVQVAAVYVAWIEAIDRRTT